jgi:hypothetical protein
MLPNVNDPGAPQAPGTFLGTVAGTHTFVALLDNPRGEALGFV